MAGILGPLILLVAVTATLVTGMAAAFGGGPPARAAVTDCATGGTPAAAPGGYQPDQLTNAATIIAVGRRLGVPPQGWVVAIATAITESGLRDLDYGDRDSLGLFQQRPSQGWGTPAQILDPGYAATQFYRHLLAIPGWQDMTVNDAAQAVQRSGRPWAYAAHEQDARQIVAAAVGSASC